VLKKISITLSIYFGNFSLWLPISLILLVFYGLFYIFELFIPKDVLIIEIGFYLIQLLLFGYLIIGLFKLALQFQGSNILIYSTARGVFTPFYLLLSPAILVILVITTTLVFSLLHVVSSVLVLYFLQFSLLLHLDKDLSIEQAILLSIKSVIKIPYKTLLCDIFCIMSLIIGFATKIGLVFFLPLSVILITVHYNIEISRKYL
jgi:uncharacterized membrane protein